MSYPGLNSLDNLIPIAFLFSCIILKRRLNYLSHKSSSSSSLSRLGTRILEKATGVKDILHSTGTTRQIIMTTLYKYAGLNNREIGSLLGVDYSTVSQGRKRLLNKAVKDKQLKQLVESIEAILSRIKI